MKLKTKIVPLLLLLFGFARGLAQNQALTTEKVVEQQIYSKQIYFDFAKADLRAVDLAVLEEIEALLRDQPQRSLRITAHTDAIGQEEANRKLSLARAESVIRFFEQRGIDRNAVAYDYFGESSPQASNTSDQGRQQNRRAQLEVLERLPVKSSVEKPKSSTVVLAPEREKDLVSLTGQVLDDEGKPIQAKVMVKSKFFRDSMYTKEDGKYRFELPDSTVLALDIFAEGYFFDSKMLRLLRHKAMPIESVLKKAACGELFPLKRMYFYGDQAVMLPRSKPELKRLLEFMTINKNLRLEIGGHINKPFVKPQNLSRKDKKLSVDRAKMVYKHLIANGIDEKRLSYQGYGNQFMLFPEARREKEMQQNRRVELKVVCKE